MRSLVRDLRQRFDLLLVDGPRWDGRPEVVAAGAACDAVYVVMPETEAESPQLDHLFQVIPEQGARLAGCILTSSRTY
jgi:Mrp family chromosome partitioning ATPase